MVTPYGRWLPAAHFFCESEASIPISEALRGIQRLLSDCLQFNDWKPSYFVIDQSAAEAKGIKNVFPGVAIFYCRFHVFRTLFTRLSKWPEIRQCMLEAFNAHSESVCQKKMQQVLI